MKGCGIMMETTLKNKDQILDQFESKLDWFYDRYWQYQQRDSDAMLYKAAYRDYFTKYGETIEYTLAALENA